MKKQLLLSLTLLTTFNASAMDVTAADAKIEELTEQYEKANEKLKACMRKAVLAHAPESQLDSLSSMAPAELIKVYNQMLKQAHQKDDINLQNELMTPELSALFSKFSEIKEQRRVLYNKSINGIFADFVQESTPRPEVTVYKDGTVEAVFSNTATAKPKTKKFAGFKTGFLNKKKNK